MTLKFDMIVAIPMPVFWNCALWSEGSSVFSLPDSRLQVEGVVGAAQLTLSHWKEKTVSPLFVRGRPVLKIQYDSGLALSCDIPALRTHLRSCWTMFAERKLKKKKGTVLCGQNSITHNREAERHTLMVECPNTGNSRGVSQCPGQTGKSDHYRPWHSHDTALQMGPYSGLAWEQKKKIVSHTTDRGSAGHLFLTIPHPCLFLPPPHQTILSTFSPCPRIWPILCTRFMMMTGVVVGSGGSDILCC